MIREKEYRKNILQKFSSRSSRQKKVGEGTGLGLWVSFGIIKSFQGDIEVDSIEGEGTTFTITFPMHSELS
jgi:two-component system cell cycle sensor histidine kinase/response regulator CckA